MSSLLRSRWALLAAFVVAACSPAPKDEVALATERVALAPTPEISPDFALGAPVVGPRNDVPIVTAVAGPPGYLVLSELGAPFARRELLSTRVLANGQITDPAGVVIVRLDSAPVTAGPVRAVRAGDHWLVVYANLAIPVGDDGQPGAASALGLGGRLAGLSWDGTQALVTASTGQGIFVNANGVPLGSPFTIFPLSSGIGGGGAVFDGTNHLVAWSTESPATVKVASVAASGPTGEVATLYNPGRPTANALDAGLVAGNGSALVQYTASPPSCAVGGLCTPLTYYARILHSAAGGAISPGTEQDLSQPCNTVYFAGRYVLACSNDVRFLDDNGAPTGTPGPYLAVVAAKYTGFGFRLTPAADGSGLLSHGGPYAARLTPGFSLVDDPLLAPLVFPATQTTPFPTFVGSQYLTAWNDSGRGGIHATRVSKSGAVVDSSPLAIALGTFRDPFAASAAGGSLVGWLTSSTVGAAHVSGTGAVTALDLAPLASPFVTSAAFGSNGAGYLLAAAIPVVGSDPPLLRAAFLSAQGAVGSKLDVPAEERRPAVAFDGQNYVVVWSELAGATATLRAARFTRSLSLLDAPPKALFTYPAADFDLTPGIASDGARSLVTWTQSGDGSIRVSRVSRALDVLDAGGVVLATDAANTRGVAAAWDGARYWVVWQGGLATDGRRYTVRARRVDPDATLADAAPFLVTDDVADVNSVPNRAVGLAADDAGGLLLTYVQDNLSTHGRTARARVLRTPSGGSGGQGGAGGSGGSGGGIGGDAGEGGLGGAAGDDGDSGAAGEAGESGAGGTGARGGSASGGNAGGGQGGRSGASGTAGAVVGGEAGASEGGSSGGGTPPDSGCGCSVPQRSSNTGFSLLVAGLLVFARRFRRGRTVPKPDKMAGAHAEGVARSGDSR